MKHSVMYEASAAIRIGLSVEAASKAEAEAIVRDLLGDTGVVRVARLEDVTGDLIEPDPNAIRGYADVSRLPIETVSVEIDESGFELIGE